MLNERQMRLKIEEEHNQNAKNHEEEVQLRLKFEAKLNNMHSAHRDLETKYRRTRQDLAQALEEKEQLQHKLNARIDEITELKSRGADADSKLVHAKERIDGMNRDLKYKADQILELEQRLNKTNDELDLMKYKAQDQQKDLTELKLRSDVLTSTNEGLRNERDHLTVELKETRALQKSYEEKNTELNE